MNYEQDRQTDDLGRWLTLAGTGALALYGFTRRSVPGLLLTMLSGSAFLRCAQGNCEVLGLCENHSHFHNAPADPTIEADIQDETSWESFPASDPPSYGRATA